MFGVFWTRTARLDSEPLEHCLRQHFDENFNREQWFRNEREGLKEGFNLIIRDTDALTISEDRAVNSLLL